MGPTSYTAFSFPFRSPAIVSLSVFHLLNAKGHRIDDREFDDILDAMREARAHPGRCIVGDLRGTSYIHLAYTSHDGWMGPSRSRRPGYALNFKHPERLPS